MLARYAGKVVTGSHLVRSVWGMHSEDKLSDLRVLIAHLRKKLEPYGGENLDSDRKQLGLQPFDVLATAAFFQFEPLLIACGVCLGRGRTAASGCVRSFSLSHILNILPLPLTIIRLWVLIPCLFVVRLWTYFGCFDTLLTRSLLLLITSGALREPRFQ